jgi:NADPH:quinone reductase-like Zn-dependent oxidoreductase
LEARQPAPAPEGNPVKAAVYDRYGPPEVLRIEDVAKPSPADDEILVRIRAAGVTRSDTHLRAGEPSIGRLATGPIRPKRRILGHELAGEVEAVGTAVTEFAPGDRVFGALPHLALTTGAHAEYMSIPEHFPIAHMPAGMAFEDAGAVCDGALLTLNVLRPVGPLSGKRLLVFGASGSLGTATVQLAKHFGAHVTAVSKPEALELVRALGADEVIDATEGDFTRGGERYDVIVDAVGRRHPYTFRHTKRSLNAGGAYLPTDGFRNAVLWLWHKRFRNPKVLFELPPRMRKEDVLLLKQLLEAGEYRPVIDRRYPLESVVEAHRYVEAGHKTGNVVLTLTQGGH